MHRHFYDNPIKPAHFYMQKVLPLVYDESLSYYEVVDKLVHKINEIGCITNTLVNDDVGVFIRRQINKIFMDSFYLDEDEKIVLVLNPAENMFISSMYVSEEEKLVFSIRYNGEVCNG